MKFLVCFLLLSTAAMFVMSASSSSHPADKFKEHKNKYNKKYTGKEELLRLALFTLVDEEIEQHNRNPDKTYEKGHNHMSDWTAEEKAQLNGGIAGTPSEPYSRFTGGRQGRAYPTSLNLATSTKCVGPVKDQGKCGSCYVFSAITNLEYSYCMSRNQTYVDLSEQQGVDCDDVQAAKLGPNYGGCKGGSSYYTWEYLNNTGGSQPTSVYGAYTSGTTGTNSTCKVTSTCSVKPKIVSKTGGYTDASRMIDALNTKGVLSVYLYASSNFHTYKSGIFDSDPLCPAPCAFQLNCPTTHAVVIVGYGTENGIDFWIVRNSYGASWGEAGYIRMKRGVNLCNIEYVMYYVVAE